MHCYPTIRKQIPAIQPQIARTNLAINTHCRISSKRFATLLLQTSRSEIAPSARKILTLTRPFYLVTDVPSSAW